MTIEGRNMLIFLDGKALAGNTQCELSQTADVIEVSSPTSGQFRKYVVGRKGWKVTASSLLMLVKGYIPQRREYVLDAKNSNVQHTVNLLGESVQVTFATTSNSNDARKPGDRTKNNELYFVGSAICTSCTITSKNGDHVSGSFEFIGDGELIGTYLSETATETGAVEGDGIVPDEEEEAIPQ